MWPCFHSGGHMRRRTRLSAGAEAFHKLKEQNFQPEPGKNRSRTTVVLDNAIRVQIGVADRYVGQFLPAGGHTGGGGGGQRVS
jgi:hypothetical protein